MLKKARGKKEFSEEFVAEKIERSKSYISRLENRKYTNPTTKVILNLSSVLEICPISTFAYITNCCSNCNLKCPNELIDRRIEK